MARTDGAFNQNPKTQTWRLMVMVVNFLQVDEMHKGKIPIWVIIITSISIIHITIEALFPSKNPHPHLGKEYKTYPGSDLVDSNTFQQNPGYKPMICFPTYPISMNTQIPNPITSMGASKWHPKHQNNLHPNKILIHRYMNKNKNKNKKRFFL